MGWPMASTPRHPGLISASQLSSGMWHVSWSDPFLDSTTGDDANLLHRRTRRNSQDTPMALNLASRSASPLSRACRPRELRIQRRRESKQRLLSLHPTDVRDDDHGEVTRRLNPDVGEVLLVGAAMEEERLR